MTRIPQFVQKNCAAAREGAQKCPHYDERIGSCASQDMHYWIEEQFERRKAFENVPLKLPANSTDEEAAAFAESQEEFDRDYRGLINYLTTDYKQRYTLNFDIATIFLYLEDTHYPFGNSCSILQDIIIEEEERKAAADAAVVLTPEPMPLQPEAATKMPELDETPSPVPVPDENEEEEVESLPVDQAPPSEQESDKKDDDKNTSESAGGGWGWFGK